ncbi:MAG: hypothetical protein PUC05_01260 [Firmicutes bacterium]|nr:hypothetical protein [Bacillota bacterium]
MFATKKTKIRRHLAQKAEGEKSAFDLLLTDYLDGTIKEDLSSAGISNISIYIDWLDSMKCIGIQGRYKEYYMDLQIYQEDFSLSFDTDEPDEDIEYPLESKEQLYRVLSDTVKTLK